MSPCRTFRDRAAVRTTALAALLLAVVGCTSPVPSAAVQMKPEVVHGSDRYRMLYIQAPGDEIEIHVRRHPEVSRIVVVRPDGYISLPLVGEVKAAGLTLPELDERLTKRLGTRLLDPEVTVVASKVREATTYVFGEVVTPRPVPLRDATTLAQAISQVGGFKPSAAQDSVVVLRITDGDQLTAIKVDVKVDGQPGPIMAAANIPLISGDLIFVPKTGIGLFNTWVDEYIGQPTSSVSQIISAYANLKLVKVIDQF